MIYICKGIGFICLAPCKLCDGACKVCTGSCKLMERCCSAMSQAWQDFWQALSDLFAPISRNPLGGYVLATFAAMLGVVLLSGVSIKNIKCDISSAKDDGKTFAAVNCGLGIVHAIFAFYIQRALVKAIGTDGAENMTHAEIAAKARYVILHDIPFCVYCIVFPASFVYNFYGLSTLKDCDVAEGNNGTGPAWAAAAMMITYGFMAWWYFVCWMCGQCCFAGAEKLDS